VVALDGVGSIATTGKITVGAAQPGFLAIQNGAVLTSDGVTFVGGISRDQLGPVDGAGSGGITTSIKPDSRSALAIPRP